ncbi:penicillin-binding protein activator [Congregibacter sp.]|uniref:penicillin-binding protein activator n=1 Tax=Congregibacter sp. TaxID=2744308 RepID=UPI003F6CE3B9
MLSLPHCRPTRLLWALCAGLLTACSSTPIDLPNRAGFPGTPAVTEGSETPAEIRNDTQHDLDVQAESLDSELFAATRAALNNGDWLNATLALPHIDLEESHSEDTPGEPRPEEARPETSAATVLWIDYYKARIALLKGDSESYEAALGELNVKPLPTDLRRELLLHELEVSQQRGDSSRQLDLSLRLLSLADTPIADDPELIDSLWSAAQHLSNADDVPNSSNPNAQGWIDLAAANQVDGPLASAAAFSAWEAQYPNHDALTHATALREAALQDARTTKLTLVLPLSGPLEKAGAAVSRGFIAAFFADEQTNVSIDVLDSRRFDNIGAAYAEAREQGASVVVGPLGKRQVGELLAQPELDVPVLTLNRPEFQSSGNPGSLLLSLAPEDEARQLAEDAFAGGARRALLIRPEGDWGERMESALVQHWRQLGGHIPTAAIYGKPDTHSVTIRDALGLGDSAQRSNTVRALFNEKVETSGRRREDLDTVFLLSKSSDEARALKPLINYHYAGGLPVYALSTADSGSENSSLNRDLGGLRLLAMPWRISEGEIPGADTATGAPSLHALGADAYAVARRWWRMRSAATPLYFGLTAELHAASDGSLDRRLKLAEFDRGEIRPR